LINLKNNFNPLEIEEAVSYLYNYFTEKPGKAVILGTGLGPVMEGVKTIKSLPYQEIPFSPVSTVVSHQGKISLAQINDELFWILAGRFHYYEGYTASQSAFMIHVLAGLGVKNLFITNAAGGVNPHFKEGELVVIEDHINLFPDHPLRGKNDESFGPRFPDMSVAYDPKMRSKIIDVSKELGISMQKGVYVGLPGPSLETPAEYRMIHILGGDVVGMSGIPEVLVARYYKVNICMISVVSNVCFPKERITETTVEEVIQIVNNSARDLGRVILKVLGEN